MRPDGFPPKAPAVPGKTLIRAVLTVGINRRRYIWFAAIGATLHPIFFVLTVTDIASGIPMASLSGAAATLLVLSIIGLNRAAMFTYDATARTVEAHDRWWGRLRTYPRRERGYERLEYSVYLARLYEVRPDGHRHEIFVRWWADRREWEAFVDRFLQDHEPSERAAAAEPDDETGDPPYRKRL